MWRTSPAGRARSRDVPCGTGPFPGGLRPRPREGGNRKATGSTYRRGVANVLNSKTEEGPDPESTSEQTSPAPLLSEPRDGIPPVVADEEELARVAAACAAGSGPVAVDAERASGYRYGQRAYLVQLRRAGAGSALVDPVACPDLAALREAVADAETVLHAAHQDLPCL